MSYLFEMTDEERAEWHAHSRKNRDYILERYGRGIDGAITRMFRCSGRVMTIYVDESTNDLAIHSLKDYRFFDEDYSES